VVWGEEKRRRRQRGPFFNISNFTRALNLLFTGCRYFSAPAFYFRTARAAASNALTLTPLFGSVPQYQICMVRNEKE
jgi:hypothetical protein